jgi:hypothetical protein
LRDVTDSYCERCGTRYTFGPMPSKGPSLAGARVLAKGLKNFVMNDEASMDDAMAAARIDVERGETARIAEEFHRTFNFCMTCRQYACDKCWNPNQAACLSCAPLSDYEPVARRTLDGIAPTTRPTADAGLGVASAEAIPWPSEDPLPGRPEPRRNGKRASESTTSVPEVAQPAPAMQPTEPTRATQPTKPPAPAEPHRAPVIGRLLAHRIPIAGPAQEQAPKVPEVLKAPKPAQALAPDSTGQADPWPQATPWAQRPIERHDSRADSDAAPLEEAEAVSDAPLEAVEATSEPAAETEEVAFAGLSPAVAEPEPVLAAQADEPVPAAHIPETAPAPATPAQQPLFTMPPATVERWPAIKRRPAGPAPVASQSAEAPAPWPPIGASWPPQNAPAAPRPGPDPALVSSSVAAAHLAEQAESPLVTAIWAESAQEVLNRGSVRVCHRCALPVSTHARFCRRCGTQQA